MTNVFGWAVIDGVHRLLTREAAWGSRLAKTAFGMNEGAVDATLLLALAQSPTIQPYTIYDAYCLQSIQEQIDDGRIVHFAVPIGGRAAANVDRERNQALLSTLPPDFQGHFHGTSPGEDGYLEWNAEVVVTTIPTARQVRLPANRIPLEVGFTQASTTWGHLLNRTGLARLPYGTDRISVFVRASF